MPVVFQYGSNALSARLNGPNRLNGNAQVLGRAQTVDDYDIGFTVYSRSNGCAASDLLPTVGQNAWGVLYEITDEFIRGKRQDGQRTLQGVEGSHYAERTIRVRDRKGDEFDAITFVVREKDRRTGLLTCAAYVSWIIYGLREHGVPEDYIRHVTEKAIETNDNAANAGHEQIELIRHL